MASIKKYRADTWRARVIRVGYPTQSKTFPTKTAAEKWARQVESSLDKGEQSLDTKAARGTTVASIFERYQNEVIALKTSSKAERNNIKRLLRNAGFMKRRLNQVTGNDIREWRDTRLSQVTAPTVSREFTSISSVFSYAIKEWGIPLAVNPARLVSRPKGSDKRREKRWTDEQIKLILEVSQWQEGRYPRCPQEFVGWAFQVALETAMRLGEICSLSVKDFNEKERYVYLAKTKNGDERYVPLSSKALQYFKFLTSGKEGDHLIFPPSGSLGLYFREFRDAVGLRGLVFHDMRHEAATRLSKKFSNVLELSAMTGHRSLQSLKRYYNPTPAEIGARLD